MGNCSAHDREFTVVLIHQFRILILSFNPFVLSSLEVVLCGFEVALCVSQELVLGGDFPDLGLDVSLELWDDGNDELLDAILMFSQDALILGVFSIVGISDLLKTGGKGGA